MFALVFATETGMREYKAERVTKNPEVSPENGRRMAGSEL